MLLYLSAIQALHSVWRVRLQQQHTRRKGYTPLSVCLSALSLTGLCCLGLWAIITLTSSAGSGVLMDVSVCDRSEVSAAACYLPCSTKAQSGLACRLAAAICQVAV